MNGSIPTNCNEFIENALRDLLMEVEAAFDADALTIWCEMLSGVDGLARKIIEEVRARDKSRDRLTVILTTNGGSIEPVRRMAEVFRRHYQHVSFIVPDHAYSAGTILAMSGDAIWMSHYSRLGPIDPQVRTKEGKWVPALGYVAQYQRLQKKDKAGTLTPAELVLLVEGFDQAELYKYEKLAALSFKLPGEWLVKYKFKDWTVTEDRKKEVTPAMRKQRATSIAKALNNINRWNTHSSGISAKIPWDELRLLIDDLDAKPEAGKPVQDYHDLLSDYMGRVGDAGVLHSRYGIVHLQ